jgi:membrane protease YdiL (CAAX protease family)
MSLLLVLAHVSQSMVRAPPVGDPWRLNRLEDGAGHLAAVDAPRADPSSPLDPGTGRRPSTPELFANVAVSHGLFAALLLGGILLAAVPWSALGVTDAATSTGLPAVALGIGLGVTIALANTVAAGLARTFGADPSRELRALLAPETWRGWLVLLAVVLPLIAGFEELLFRAALVGGFAAGFGVSPWVLAVLSSIAFAAGHGAQGALGVAVTGLLGLALATAFVLTGSLLAVVIAHYVVNAIEFVVAEGIGWRPFE